MEHGQWRSLKPKYPVISQSRFRALFAKPAPVGHVEDKTVQDQLLYSLGLQPSPQVRWLDPPGTHPNHLLRRWLEPDSSAIDPMGTGFVELTGA